MLKKKKKMENEYVETEHELYMTVFSLYDVFCLNSLTCSCFFVIKCKTIDLHASHPGLCSADNRTYHFQAEDEQEFVM